MQNIHPCRVPICSGHICYYYYILKTYNILEFLTILNLLLWNHIFHYSIEGFKSILLEPFADLQTACLPHRICILAHILYNKWWRMSTWTKNNHMIPWMMPKIYVQWYAEWQPKTIYSFNHLSKIPGMEVDFNFGIIYALESLCREFVSDHF